MSERLTVGDLRKAIMFLGDDVPVNISLDVSTGEDDFGNRVFSTDYFGFQKEESPRGEVTELQLLLGGELCEDFVCSSDSVT